VRCPCGGLNDACPICGGSGVKPACPCGGLGYVARALKDELWRGWTVEVCPRCKKAPPVFTLPTGLDDVSSRWTFDQVYDGVPQLSDAVSKLEAWAVAKEGWYILASSWGTGKTFLLSCLVNHWHKEGLDAMYWVTSPMLQALQDATFDRHPEWSFGALYKALVEVPLLCLDEFGHVKLTPRREEWLRSILVERSTGVWRPTVFATNEGMMYFSTHMPWLVSRWSASLTAKEIFEGVPDLRVYFKELEEGHAFSL